MLIAYPSQLYGLFKQGTQDPKFEDTKAPGMFELKVSASPCYECIARLLCLLREMK